MTIKQQGGIFGRNPTFNDVSVDGSLTVDTNTLYVNPTNNRVGVGTTDPAASFDVSRSHSVNGVAGVVANPQAAISNPFNWGYPTGVLFRTPLTSGGGLTNNAAVWSQWSSTNNAYLGFAVAQNNSLVEIMRVTGSGITFNGDTAAANALDDYEEGTWTPADGSGAGLTFSSASGTYTKIGNTVRVTATLAYPSNSDGSNTLVTGLPFTAGGNAPLAFFNGTATAGDMAIIANGTSGVYFYTTSLTRRTNIQYSGALIYLSGVYYV